MRSVNEFASFQTNANFNQNKQKNKLMYRKLKKIISQI